MDTSAIKLRLQSEGYVDVHEYEDDADEFLPDHNHPGDQLLIVVRGSIAITMDGETRTLNVGDEIFFPAKRMHSAKVGPEGCLYIVGEKPSL